MRHEKVGQIPCGKCDAPIVEIATFCCSDAAHLICRKCGNQQSVKSKDVDEQLMHKLYATSGWGDKPTVWRQFPDVYDPKKYKYGYDFKKATEEEATEFLSVLEQYGYTEVKGPQIGFLGEKQVFETPIQL